MWFWRPRDRFSLDELKYLNEQLQRVTVINDSNKDFVVETLRSMAELMIWGDQHDPLFFDYFMEKQVMAHFLRILNASNKNGSIAVQLLQTLSIIIGNIRSEHAIYYLFSNEYINTLITYPFDFRHEEVLAYYISFLRTISMKLDTTTVSFFIKTKDEKVTSFPLYTEAIKFFHHEESMVRIAVRTLTLNVYNVDDKGIQSFVMEPPVVDYFSDLVTFLRQQSINLDSLVAEATRAPQSAPMIGRLEAAIAEIGDLLFYCNDIMGSGIPGLNELLSKHVFDLLVKPVLVPSLCPDRESTADMGVMQVSPLCSMYLFSRLLHIIKRRPLVNLISAALLQITQSASAINRENGAVQTWGSSINMSKPVNASGEDESTDPSSTLKVEASIQDRERESHERAGLFQAPSMESPPTSPREALVSYLLHLDDKLVLASLCVLVALLQTEDLDEMLLDALGILPRQKKHKHMLFQALMGPQSEEEPEYFADPPAHLEEDISLGFKNFKIADYVGSMNGRPKYNGDFPDCVSPGSRSRRHRQEVLDALMQLLSRRPPPCAEALWHAGWLLRQLLPFNGHKLSTAGVSLLDNAYSAAREDINKEVADCWSDVIPTVVTDEWKVCRKALESPSLQRDSSFVLLPRFSDSLVEGDLRTEDKCALALYKYCFLLIISVVESGREISSSAVGERMRAAVKVFVALHQMRHLLSKGTWPELPAFGWPKEETESTLLQVGLHLSAVRVGAELNLIEGKAMACRVAFERGKERSVFLMIVHKEKDTSSWLLLVEELYSRQGHGVVRVIAPLAGSKPRVDDAHPRWLHLRIRSPHWPSADAGKLGTNGSRAKRLVDGRWTLAFSDEEKCKVARSLVAQMIHVQASLVKQVLSPLIESTIDSQSLDDSRNLSPLFDSTVESTQIMDDSRN